jgi:hypothetical protein
VLISDDVPVDESHRDEILENFQATFHGATGRIVIDDDVVDDEEEEDEPEELDAEPEGFGDEER